MQKVSFTQIIKALNKDSVLEVNVSLRNSKEIRINYNPSIPTQIWTSHCHNSRDSGTEYILYFIEVGELNMTCQYLDLSILGGGCCMNYVTEYRAPSRFVGIAISL